MDFLNDLLGFAEAAVPGVLSFCPHAFVLVLRPGRRHSLGGAQLPAGLEGHAAFLDHGSLSRFFEYRMAWAFMEAGEKALTALILRMTVFIRGMPIIVLAGVVAAAGAWVINNVNF